MLFGEEYKLSLSVSSGGLKCLTMPSSGGWKMQHSSAHTEMAKDLFGLSTLIDLKCSNLGDPNLSERSIGVLWGWK